jgi:hypothetical protein
MATNGSNLRRGAPRGKRKLPRGVVCVRRCITLHPRHDEILERIGRSIPGGRSAALRQLLDAAAASAARQNSLANIVAS